MFSIIAILAFLVSLVAGMQAVEVARANPYRPPPFYPPTPNTDPPTITIQSPINATYNLNNIPLNITVIQPSSWHQNNLTTVYINKVSYELDGKIDILWEQVPPESLSPVLESVTNYSATLSNLARGQHTLKVNIVAYSPFDSNQRIVLPQLYWERWNTTSQTIRFTVEILAPSPSSTPTLIPSPSPTPSPTPSPPPSVSPSSPTQQPTQSPTPNNTQTENFTPTVIIVGLVIAVVVVGLLVYFAKHRGMK